MCHIGEVAISVYEVALFLDKGELSDFSEGVRNVIVVNHLLIIMNRYVKTENESTNVKSRDAFILFTRTD